MKPFRTLRRILSHLKDCISDDDKSSVVYKINFHDCDASYVGLDGEDTQDTYVGAPQGSGDDRLLCFCSSTACIGIHRLDKHVS